MPFHESRQEFIQRQGCESLKLGFGYDEEVLFANGASIVGQDGFRGVVYSEPPQDPHHLLHAQRRFVREKLQQERQRYNDYLNEVSTQARHAMQFPANCPMPPDSALDCLRRGQQRIHKLEGQLENLNKQIDNTPERQRRQAAKQQTTERVQAAQEQLDRLAAYADPNAMPPEPLEPAFQSPDKVVTQISHPPAITGVTKKGRKR